MVLIWSAFRFGNRGVSIAIVIIFSVAPFAALTHGIGPFVRAKPEQSPFWLLVLFLGTISLVTFTMGAILTGALIAAWRCLLLVHPRAGTIFAYSCLSRFVEPLLHHLTFTVKCWRRKGHGTRL